MYRMYLRIALRVRIEVKKMAFFRFIQQLNGSLCAHLYQHSMQQVGLQGHVISN